MTEKGIAFVSKQTKIREFYSASELFGKSFADVADDLYDKLLRENRVLPTLIAERKNELADEYRVGLIKFFYLVDGLETPISKAMPVLEFYLNTGASEVLFFVDVIGGDVPAKDTEAFSHYQFLNHAQEVLENADRHGTWELMEYLPNQFRLVKTVRDKYRRLITLVLQPNVGYPRRPPRVITIPQHRDPCFARNGELDWTIIRGSGRFTWELYMRHSNPLIYLLDELNTKYGLMF
jgi:hypothetical protein